MSEKVEVDKDNLEKILRGAVDLSISIGKLTYENNDLRRKLNFWKTGVFVSTAVMIILMMRM